MLNSTLEYFVSLTIPLNATQRLQLINGFFNNNVRINSSYELLIKMIINTVTNKIGKYNN
jgi:hypothetical protein